MLLLSDALKKCKENGATDDNAAILVNVYMRWRWLALILKRFSVFKTVVTYGKVEDDHFVYSSTWTAKSKEEFLKGKKHFKDVTLKK